MSGYTGQQAELYYSLPVAVTKNTYTTIAPISALTTTSVPRCVIPALYFSQIGKSIHFEANGTVVATGTPTFIWSGGLNVVAGTLGGTGGATLFASATLAQSSSLLPWTIEADIVCQAVGGAASGTAGGTTLQVNGEIDVHSGLTSTWQTGRNSLMFSNNITSVNNEINLFLELFGTWSASSASNSTVLQQFKVYLEN